MTDSTDSERANRTWSVTVAVNGSEVLTIESNCLSGAPNIDDYADEIRTCANNLLSFIGEPHGNAGEDAEGDSFFNMLWDWFEDDERFESLCAACRAPATPSTDRLAPGCCSAISPCSHQQQYPSSICGHCQAAALTSQDRGTQ